MLKLDHEGEILEKMTYQRRIKKIVTKFTFLQKNIAVTVVTAVTAVVAVVVVVVNRCAFVSLH